MRTSKWPARHQQPTVVHVVHSLDGGGTERTLVNLLRGFDSSIFRHVVVTLRDAGSLAGLLPGHVACHAIRSCGRSWLAGLRLASVTRLYRAAVIHARNTCCWNDGIAATMLTPGARLVLGFHGLEAADRFSLRQRLSAFWGVRLGADFTTVSEYGREQLHRDAGVPYERIKVLPNGVKLELFAEVDDTDRVQTRAALGFADSDLVVGVVGSLTPVKRHAVLIEAIAAVAKDIPDVRLLVVGDGPLRADLVRQAQNASPANLVRFAGWRDDIPAMLAGMDAYVCCSESEGASNALLEAMASGLAIVTTEVGDHGRILRDGVDAFLVRPGSSSAIADALAVLLRASGLRVRFGASARRRAADFGFGKMMRAYEAYYRGQARRGTEGRPGSAEPLSAAVHVGSRLSA